MAQNQIAGRLRNGQQPKKHGDDDTWTVRLDDAYRVLYTWVNPQNAEEPIRKAFEGIQSKRPLMVKRVGSKLLVLRQILISDQQNKKKK
jgi:hypothetical protein